MATFLSMVFLVIMSVAPYLDNPLRIDCTCFDDTLSRVTIAIYEKLDKS